MAMMVPPEVGKLFQVLTGEEWPKANEDHLLALSQAWRNAATRMDAELAPQLAQSLMALRSSYTGKAALKFADQMAPFVLESPFYLQLAVVQFYELSKLARKTGQEVEYIKLVSILSLIALLIEIAWAIAMAGPTFGSSMAWAAARMAIVRVLLKTWWGRLLLRIAMAAVIGVGFQVAIDVSAQTIQIAKGTRKITEWDTNSTVTAVKLGLMGAALALPFGALGNLVGNLLSTILVKGLGNKIDNQILAAAAKHAAAKHADELPNLPMAKFADLVSDSIDNYAGMSVKGMWAAKFGKGLADTIQEGMHEMFTEATYKAAIGQGFVLNPYAGTAGASSGLASNIGNVAGAAIYGKLGPPPGDSPYLGKNGDADTAGLLDHAADIGGYSDLETASSDGDSIFSDTTFDDDASIFSETTLAGGSTFDDLVAKDGNSGTGSAGTDFAALGNNGATPPPVSGDGAPPPVTVTPGANGAPVTAEAGGAGGAQGSAEGTAGQSNGAGLPGQGGNGLPTSTSPSMAPDGADGPADTSGTGGPVTLTATGEAFVPYATGDNAPGANGQAAGQSDTGPANTPGTAGPAPVNGPGSIQVGSAAPPPNLGADSSVVQVTGGWVSASQVSAGINPGSSSVVVTSAGNAGRDVTITAGNAAKLATDLGQDVTALQPGRGRRPARWMTFPANGGRPKPASATPDPIGVPTTSTTQVPQGGQVETGGQQTVSADSNGRPVTTGRTPAPPTVPAATSVPAMPKPIPAPPVTSAVPPPATPSPATPPPVMHPLPDGKGHLFGGQHQPVLQQIAATLRPDTSAQTVFAMGRPDRAQLTDAVRSVRPPGDTRPIRLISCDFAIGGLSSDAAHLALATDAPVLAPKGWVWQPTTPGGPNGVVSSPVVNPDGTVKPAFPADGQWVFFVPNPDGTVTMTELGPNLPENLAEASGNPTPSQPDLIDLTAADTAWMHWAPAPPPNTAALTNDQVALLLGGPVEVTGLADTAEVRAAIAASLAARAQIPLPEATTLADAHFPHGVIADKKTMARIAGGGYRITIRTSRGPAEVLLGGDLGPRKATAQGDSHLSDDSVDRIYPVTNTEDARQSSGRSSTKVPINFNALAFADASPPLVKAGAKADLTLASKSFETGARYGHRENYGTRELGVAGSETRDFTFTVAVNPLDGGHPLPTAPVEVTLGFPDNTTFGPTIAAPNPLPLFGQVHHVNMDPSVIAEFGANLPAEARTPGTQQHRDLTAFLGGDGMKGNAKQTFGSGAVSPMFGDQAFVLKGQGRPTYLGRIPGKPNSWQWVRRGASETDAHGSGAGLTAGAEGGGRWFPEGHNDSPWGQFSGGATYSTNHSTSDGIKKDRLIESLYIQSTPGETYLYEVEVLLTPPGGGAAVPRGTMLVSMPPHDAQRMGYPVPASAPPIRTAPPPPNLVSDLGIVSDSQIREARGGDQLIQPVIDAVRRVDPKLLPPAPGPGSNLVKVTKTQHENLSKIHHAFNNDMRAVTQGAVLGGYTLNLSRDTITGQKETEVLIGAAQVGNPRFDNSWNGGRESQLRYVLGEDRVSGVSNSNKIRFGASGGWDTGVKDGFRRVMGAIGLGALFGRSYSLSAGHADGAYVASFEYGNDIHGYWSDLDFTIAVSHTDRPVLGWKSPIDERTTTETALAPIPAAPGVPIRITNAAYFASPVDELTVNPAANRAGVDFQHGDQILLQTGPPAPLPAGVDLSDIGDFQVVHAKVTPQLAQAADIVLAKQITTDRPPPDGSGLAPHQPPDARDGLGLFSGTWKSWGTGHVDGTGGSTHSYKKSPLSQKGTQSKLALDSRLGPLGHKGGAILAVDGTDDPALGLGESGLMTDLRGNMDVKANLYNPRIITRPKVTTIFRIQEAIRSLATGQKTELGIDLGASGEFIGKKDEDRPTPKWVFGGLWRWADTLADDMSNTVGGRGAYRGPTVVVEFDVKHQFSGGPSATNWLPNVLTQGKGKDVSVVVSNPNGLYLRMPEAAAQELVRKHGTPPPGAVAPPAPVAPAPGPVQPPANIPPGSSIGNTKVSGHTLADNFETDLATQLQNGGASAKQAQEAAAEMAHKLTNRSKRAAQIEQVGGGIRVQHIEPTAKGDVVLTLDLRTNLTNRTPAPPTHQMGTGVSVLTDLINVGEGHAEGQSKAGGFNLGATPDYTRLNDQPGPKDNPGTGTGGGTNIPMSISQMKYEGRSIKTSSSRWQELFFGDTVLDHNYDAAYQITATLFTIPRTVIDVATLGAADALFYDDPTNVPVNLPNQGTTRLSVPAATAAFDLTPPGAVTMDWQPLPAGPPPALGPGAGPQWTLPVDAYWRVESFGNSENVRDVVMASLAQNAPAPGATGTAFAIPANVEPSVFTKVGTPVENALFNATTNGSLKGGARRMFVGEKYGVPNLPQPGIVTNKLADLGIHGRMSGQPTLVPRSITTEAKLEVTADSGTTTVDTNHGTSASADVSTTGFGSADRIHPAGNDGRVEGQFFDAGTGANRPTGAAAQASHTSKELTVLEQGAGGRSYVFAVDYDLYIDTRARKDYILKTAWQAASGRTDAPPDGVIHVHATDGVKIRVWERDALANGLWHAIAAGTGTLPPATTLAGVGDGTWMHSTGAAPVVPIPATPTVPDGRTLHVGTAPAGTPGGGQPITGQQVLDWVNSLDPHLRPTAVVLHQDPAGLGAVGVHQLVAQLGVPVTVPVSTPPTWNPIVQTETYQPGAVHPTPTGVRPNPEWTILPGNQLPDGTPIQPVPSGIVINPTGQLPAAPPGPTGPVVHTNGATGTQTSDLLLSLTDDLRPIASIDNTPAAQWYAQRIEPAVANPVAVPTNPVAAVPAGVRDGLADAQRDHAAETTRYQQAIDDLTDAEQALLDAAQLAVDAARANPSRANWQNAHALALSANPNHGSLTDLKGNVHDRAGEVNNIRGRWIAAQNQLNTALNNVVNANNDLATRANQSAQDSTRRAGA